MSAVVPRLVVSARFACVLPRPVYYSLPRPVYYITHCVYNPAPLFKMAPKIVI